MQVPRHRVREAYRTARLRYISVLIYVGGVERGDEKPIRWVGSALDDLRDFPADVQGDLGYQIGRVQQGLERR